MKNPKLELLPDWLTLPKDVWRSISATMSPLDVSRLRATCGFFRSTIADTAQNFRNCSVNVALYRAARCGHRDIVELMIENGATDFNSALQNAAAGGHRDIVELMIEKGATDFYGALCSAANGGGHRDIVELLIEKRRKRK